MTAATAVGAGHGQAGTDRRVGPGVALVALLLVVGSVGWRRGEYFTGALDPVVLGKAVVSGLALALAFGLAASGPRRRLGTASLWWLGVLLTGSVFGALAGGLLLPGGVVAVRVAVLGASVFFLLRAAPAAQVVTALTGACGVVAAVAAATGLPASSGDRLAGGLPALSPNELALLAGIVVLHASWRAVTGRPDPATLAVVAAGLGVVWATGSRTGLLMLLCGLLVVGLHLRRPRPVLVAGVLVTGAAGAVAAVATGAVQAFLARGGDGVSTLESRFIAWRAATTWATSTWQQVFGGGLSVKIIRVRGQYWDTQPLDSSWVSLLVQAGLLGLVVAAGWSAWVVRGALRGPRENRGLHLALLVFLLGRSTVESGLFDATPAFLFFLVISLVGERGSRERVPQPGAAPQQHGTADVPVP